MSKTRLAIAVTVVLVPVVAFQFVQNTTLKKELNALESEVGELRTEAAGTIGPLSGLTSKEEKEALDKAKAEAAAAAEKEAIAAAANSALGSILAERDPLVRLQALLDYVGKVGIAEIPNVLVKLRENTPDWDPEARMAAHIMLTRWGKADPDAAFAYIATLDYKKGGGDAAVVLGALAAQDPNRAVEWLSDPTNKLAHLPWMGDILAGTIGKEWVRQDPDAALAWAQSLPKNQQSGAFAGVLQSIAAIDPSRASALAMELDAGQEKREIIEHIAETWGQRSPKEAIDWALALDGDDRERALGRALGGWAQDSPSEAAAYVDSLDGDSREESLHRVASTWARQEPAAAAEWIGAQDESEGKARAMGDVMWNWTVADPGAASEWLGQQPVGPSRDTGIESLGKATFDNDPNAAVSWAATISDEKRRGRALEIGLHVWQERDAAAAQDWIESSELITDAEAQAFMAEAAEK